MPSTLVAFSKTSAPISVARERGRGVGREERVSGAGGENQNAAFFQMPHGAAADEGLADAVHADRRLNARGLPHFFHRLLKRDGVENRRQHAHVIGRGAGDVAILGERRPANEIAAAYDDGELDAHLGDLNALLSDGVEFGGFDAEGAFVAETFAADFEEDSRIGGSRSWLARFAWLHGRRL